MAVMHCRMVESASVVVAKGGEPVPVVRLAGVPKGEATGPC